MSKGRVLSIRFHGVPSEDIEDEIVELVMDGVQTVLTEHGSHMDFDVDGVLEDLEVGSQ